MNNLSVGPREGITFLINVENRLCQLRNVISQKNLILKHAAARTSKLARKSIVLLLGIEIRQDPLCG